MDGSCIDMESIKNAASYMKKAGKTGASKTIGYIPIIGDVASFVIDTATDYKESQENVKIVQEQLDSIKSAKLYREFGYNVNFVEYDTADSEETRIVANQGKNTINIINQVNCDLELDISENETFTRPDEVYKKITDEISDNPNKQKNIMMQSKRYIENAKEACGCKDFEIMQLLEEQESNLQSLSKKLGEFREIFRNCVGTIK